ncbi:S66 peptidase family protein [Pararhizobium sp. DWP1-1-3]|uniref:S66 peptidase family protein n=1 Tax=Pararhizobium sp. DWP1-1-3 TaxID=2804652 RepID=UPI003CF431CB
MSNIVQTGAAFRPAIVTPGKLKPGDRIRFVSPASTPDRDEIVARVRSLEELGFKVDFGAHAFNRHGFLAGTDGERLDDLNSALRDPDVRAIFATRGGKGAYRIADRLDFDAVRLDPKPLVGFSDITILHLMLLRQCGVAGIHGALFRDGDGGVDLGNRDVLGRMLMEAGRMTIPSRPNEPTARLTTKGKAKGVIAGGNLELIVTAAGWALPDMTGTILLLEAVDCYPGRVDRALTMLRKAGHLDGVAGVAVGQFLMVEPSRGEVIIDIVRDHLDVLGVPVLGGLPIGHGERPVSLPIGTMAELDADLGILTAEY